MAQRGLEDWEVALIKRMMREDYARDKMHAYFNRPDRTLTPAAYSEIKAGKFGTEVPEASAELLARFVERYNRSPESAASDPIGALALAKLLALTEEGLHLRSAENDQVEFKASFSFAENTLSKIVRAMAALANNAGGYILCGVEDSSGKVRGLSPSCSFDGDLSRWSQAIKACLMPVPVFDRIVVPVGSVNVGIIYVEPAASKPVIAIKNHGDKIRAGAIYFRYPGQSADIGYGELTTLLQERDRKAQQILLSSLNLIAERDPAEIAIIDLRNAEMMGGDKPLARSDEFVRQLSVIREGEFVERGGAPAVRILADATIQTDGPQQARVVRGYVSDASLVRNFIFGEPVEVPLQYFLAAINSQSDWLPMFRWMDDAAISITQAADMVEAENLTPKKRLRALERLSGVRTARIPSIKSLRPLVNALLSGQAPGILTARELRRQMNAVRMAVAVSADQIPALRAAVQRGFTFAWAPQNGGDLQSYVKAAAGRLDELTHELKNAG